MTQSPLAKSPANGMLATQDLFISKGHPTLWNTGNHSAAGRKVLGEQISNAHQIKDFGIYSNVLKWHKLLRVICSCWVKYRLIVVMYIV
jgi:hypothetical protein